MVLKRALVLSLYQVDWKALHTLWKPTFDLAEKACAMPVVQIDLKASDLNGVLKTDFDFLILKTIFNNCLCICYDYKEFEEFLVTALSKIKSDEYEQLSEKSANVRAIL